jgi:putative Holliday junction resolvase
VSRILAIDCGSKRVGLAVTDPMQIIATALDTVHSQDAINYLKAYTFKNEVELFIVGEPKHNDGTASQSTAIIEAFIVQLKKNIPEIPIEREDERFTSKMAFQTMIDSGIGREKRKNKKLVDKIAAVIILQSYLERRSHE